MDFTDITTYQAGVAQSAAYRRLNKLFSELLVSHGLTCMHWFIIGTILDSGKQGIQMTQLADRLQTGVPFITNTINLLESKGMVERKTSQSDSRTKHVSISPKYVKTCKRIEAELSSAMQTSIYADIPPEELRIYLRVLYQLSEMKQPE